MPALVRITVPSLCLCLAVACATGARQPRSDRGRITIGVTTAGVEAAALTFRVSIDPAGIDEAVKADAGVLTRGDIPPGSHVVRLSGVPPRCQVRDGGERRILMPERGSIVVRFAVQCS